MTLMDWGDSPISISVFVAVTTTFPTSTSAPRAGPVEKITVAASPAIAQIPKPFFIFFSFPAKGQKYFPQGQVYWLGAAYWPRLPGPESSGLKTGHGFEVIGYREKYFLPITYYPSSLTCFFVVFVPLTVAGQQWIYTTFP
jgi:hypothetical protein